MTGSGGRAQFTTKLAAAMALVAIAEIGFAGFPAGAVVGGFALVWLTVLVATRRAIVRDRAARWAMLAAAGLGFALVDDPSLLAWSMFWAAISLAALLPRRRFDDALAWGKRLAWHALSGLAAPLYDLAQWGAVKRRRVIATTGGRAAMILIPVVGGGAFIALFAMANPLIGDAFEQIALPDGFVMAWRTLFAMVVAAAVWPSLRPRASVSGMAASERNRFWRFDANVATLIVSLLTFNAIFAVENVLDVVFLWSGAPLPDSVTMADYAHRGAYSLIATALLAGLFVLVALRPNSPGAASPAVRWLLGLWIAQNVLLVASSALRTLDYVDAYGMTIWRLAALAWMGLVAAGLVLIGWRLLRGRSAAWLINANTLAATLVLGAACVVDLGAVAAAWNARVALAQGRNGPPLDLCYLGGLGEPALVPLADLERHAAKPGLRDRLSYLRWSIQLELTAKQADWRSWTPRGARRLAAAEALAGATEPALRKAPWGRLCGGEIASPSDATARPPGTIQNVAPMTTPLTEVPEQ